jgi:hypothetical protein
MVGEGTVEVENPAEALRNEDGTFNVTSPYGHIFRVTCRRGRNMRVREIARKVQRLPKSPIMTNSMGRVPNRPLRGGKSRRLPEQVVERRRHEG